MYVPCPSENHTAMKMTGGGGLECYGNESNAYSSGRLNGAYKRRENICSYRRDSNFPNVDNSCRFALSLSACVNLLAPKLLCF